MVYGEEASKNTHRVFKVQPNGVRTCLHSGNLESASEAAHRLAQKPIHAGARMVVETHNGKDPK